MQVYHNDPRLHVVVEERWYWQRNRRRYSTTKPKIWKDVPLIHAITVMTIEVDQKHRRNGICREFLNRLCEDSRFEMVVVEKVQNPHLRDALTRWGWECDPVVSDYFMMRAPARTPKAEALSKAVSGRAGRSVSVGRAGQPVRHR